MVIVCLSFWGFIYHALQELNKGILLDFIFGKYYTTKEDKRVFMFLDLKSSATIVKKLFLTD